MTVLDPAGLEAAARVIEGPFPTVAEEAASADLAAAAVSAYLAALPVPSDAENPWRDRPGLTETHDERKERRAKCEGFHRGFAAGRAAAHLPDGVLAFVNWFAEGPCGCDGESDDPCDSCRALALLGELEGTAAAHPDPRVPSGLPIGYGGPTVKTDPVALLARIKAVVDEPLDERDGHGPTRTGQFARIDALLRDVPPAPAASPDPPTDPGVIPGPDPGACPSCGGWRKAGMIHRCEVEEDAIRADERERLSARVYENGWCPTCAATAAAASPDPPGWACASCGAVSDRQSCRACGAECRPAASPDERLREALAWIAEYGERNGDLRTGHLQAVKHIARNALGLEPDLPLAAADREAPDEEEVR